MLWARVSDEISCTGIGLVQVLHQSFSCDGQGAIRQAILYSDRKGSVVQPFLTIVCRPIKDDNPVLIMMFSRRLSGTDSQVASLGTECNQNLKVCVYRLQRLLSFVGLLYLSRKVRSICLIILQTLTLYQQLFPD